MGPSEVNTEHCMQSRPEWDHLEDLPKGQVQGHIQHVLEDTVTEFLDRVKSARPSGEDSDDGYRNGYAAARRPTLSSGTITMRRPRVRDSEESSAADESSLMPLFVKGDRQVAELIPKLYLH